MMERIGFGIKSCNDAKVLGRNELFGFSFITYVDSSVLRSRKSIMYG